ncbi:hypothetical protein VNO77_08705 [Canavalia gladiata]|uniref:Uncharacterized protein n=1 Tax=Canavalia gladiata TaxID=3824 RepID=A0AAN9QWP7_CANGL
MIQTHGTLDNEAQPRSTSVYMLQRKLSVLLALFLDNIGLLNPGVGQLAVSILMDISHETGCCRPLDWLDLGKVPRHLNWCYMASTWFSPLSLSSYAYIKAPVLVLGACLLGSSTFLGEWGSTLALGHVWTRSTTFLMHSCQTCTPSSDGNVCTPFGMCAQNFNTPLHGNSSEGDLGPTPASFQSCNPGPKGKDDHRDPFLHHALMARDSVIAFTLPSLSNSLGILCMARGAPLVVTCRGLSASNFCCGLVLFTR